MQEQEVKVAFGVTGTAANARLYGGPLFPRVLEDATKELIEQAAARLALDDHEPYQGLLTLTVKEI